MWGDPVSLAENFHLSTLLMRHVWIKVSSELVAFIASLIDLFHN